MSRRTSTGETLLKSAQNQLRGAADLRSGLSKARSAVPAVDMDAFVAWLPTQRRKGRGLRLPDLPDSVGDLWSSSPLASVGLSREIAWAHAVMRRSATMLTDFRRAAESYETVLLEGNFGKATEILDGIEDHAGVSLWSLETRLALLQRARGLEAQKAYASEIFAIRGRHDVVAFLTHHLSRRNEPSTTPLRYEQHLDGMTEQWIGSEDLAAYVMHRLVNRLPRDARGHANLLRFESSASTIDHYETFVTLRDMRDDRADPSSWIVLARAGGEPDVADAAHGHDLTAAVLARCSKIVHRSDEMDEALIRLLKEALNNRLQRFSSSVTAFLWTEMSNTPSETRELERFAFVYGRSLRPSDVGRLEV